MLSLVLGGAATGETTDTQLLKLCDAANDSCKILVEKQKLVITTQDDLIAKLREQRNDAVKAANSGLPWYVWVLVGGAGTTIAIRGLK